MNKTQTILAVIALILVFGIVLVIINIQNGVLPSGNETAAVNELGNVKLSSDAKSASIELSPEQEYYSHSFSGFYLVVSSDEELVLEDGWTDNATGLYDFGDIEIETGFIEQQANTINLDGGSTAVELKQYTIVTNTGSASRSIALSFYSYFNTIDIKVSGEELHIEQGEKYTFTPEDEVIYFTFETDEGTSTFNWDDISSYDYVVSLWTEDGENTIIETSIPLDLAVGEVVNIDPSFGSNVFLPDAEPFLEFPVAKESNMEIMSIDFMSVDADGERNDLVITGNVRTTSESTVSSSLYSVDPSGLVYVYEKVDSLEKGSVYELNGKGYYAKIISKEEIRCAAAGNLNENGKDGLVIATTTAIYILPDLKGGDFDLEEDWDSIGGYKYIDPFASSEFTETGNALLIDTCKIVNDDILFGAMLWKNPEGEGQLRGAVPIIDNNFDTHPSVSGNNEKLKNLRETVGKRIIFYDTLPEETNGKIIEAAKIKIISNVEETTLLLGYPSLDGVFSIKYDDTFVNTPTKVKDIAETIFTEDPGAGASLEVIKKGEESFVAVGNYEKNEVSIYNKEGEFVSSLTGEEETSFGYAVKAIDDIFIVGNPTGFEQIEIYDVNKNLQYSFGITSKTIGFGFSFASYNGLLAVGSPKAVYVIKVNYGECQDEASCTDNTHCSPNGVCDLIRNTCKLYSIEEDWCTKEGGKFVPDAPNPIESIGIQKEEIISQIEKGIGACIFSDLFDEESECKTLAEDQGREYGYEQYGECECAQACDQGAECWTDDDCGGIADACVGAWGTCTVLGIDNQYECQTGLGGVFEDDMTTYNPLDGDCIIAGISEEDCIDLVGNYPHTYNGGLGSCECPEYSICEDKEYCDCLENQGCEYCLWGGSCQAVGDCPNQPAVECDQGFERCCILWDSDSDTCAANDLECFPKCWDPETISCARCIDGAVCEGIGDCPGGECVEVPAKNICAVVHQDKITGESNCLDEPMLLFFFEGGTRHISWEWNEEADACYYYLIDDEETGVNEAEEKCKNFKHVYSAEGYMSEHGQIPAVKACECGCVDGADCWSDDYCGGIEDACVDGWGVCNIDAEVTKINGIICTDNDGTFTTTTTGLLCTIEGISEDECVSIVAQMNSQDYTYTGGLGSCECEEYSICEEGAYCADDSWCGDIEGACRTTESICTIPGLTMSTMRNYRENYGAVCEQESGGGGVPSFTCVFEGINLAECDEYGLAGFSYSYVPESTECVCEEELTIEHDCLDEMPYSGVNISAVVTSPVNIDSVTLYYWVGAGDETVVEMDHIGDGAYTGEIPAVCSDTEEELFYRIVVIDSDGNSVTVECLKIPLDPCELDCDPTAGLSNQYIIDNCICEGISPQGLAEGNSYVWTNEIGVGGSADVTVLDDDTSSTIHVPGVVAAEGWAVDVDSITPFGAVSTLPVMTVHDSGEFVDTAVPYNFEDLDNMYLVLCENIGRPGTTFEIKDAENIVLDGNGHTVGHTDVGFWDDPAYTYGIHIDNSQNIKVIDCTFEKVGVTSNPDVFNIYVTGDSEVTFNNITGKARSIYYRGDSKFESGTIKIQDCMINGDLKLGGDSITTADNLIVDSLRVFETAGVNIDGSTINDLLYMEGKSQTTVDNTVINGDVQIVSNNGEGMYAGGFSQEPEYGMSGFVQSESFPSFVVELGADVTYTSFENPFIFYLEDGNNTIVESDVRFVAAEGTSNNSIQGSVFIETFQTAGTSDTDFKELAVGEVDFVKPKVTNNTILGEFGSAETSIIRGEVDFPDDGCEARAGTVIRYYPVKVVNSEGLPVHRVFLNAVEMDNVNCSDSVLTNTDGKTEYVCNFTIYSGTCEDIINVIAESVIEAR